MQFHSVQISRWTHLNALIVNDEPISLMVLKSMFKEKLSFNKVETACNGKIAVEKVLEGNYDLILMDLNMPIMDGFTATS